MQNANEKHKSDTDEIDAGECKEKEEKNCKFARRRNDKSKTSRRTEPFKMHTGAPFNSFMPTFVFPYFNKSPKLNC